MLYTVEYGVTGDKLEMTFRVTKGSEGEMEALFQLREYPYDKTKKMLMISPYCKLSEAAAKYYECEVITAPFHTIKDLEDIPKPISNEFYIIVEKDFYRDNMQVLEEYISLVLNYHNKIFLIILEFDYGNLNDFDSDPIFREEAFRKAMRNKIEYIPEDDYDQYNEYVLDPWSIKRIRID